MTNNDLHKLLDRQMGMLEKFKAREQSIAQSLANIQKSARNGAREADILHDINTLMKSDLKEAQDLIQNWKFALKIAISGLQGATDIGAAVVQLKVLVPEMFGEKVTS